MRALQFTLVLLLSASQSALADFQMNLPYGVTPVSHDIYNLHMTILAVCVIIGIIVFTPMFYALIHHRKSKNAIPAQFHEHLSLELTWTLIPLIILIGMAVPSTLVLIHINRMDSPDLTIKITAYQWKWNYEYLNEHIQFFSNNNTPYAQIHNQIPKDDMYLRSVDHPLVVPIHKKIRFLITSNDVVHSWWVQPLGVKRQAVPGFITESWAIIERPGIYYGQCAELCGLNHAYMTIVVAAMAQKDFENWLIVQKGGKPSAPVPIILPSFAPAVSKPTGPPRVWNKDELIKQGEQVFLNVCSVCHQPDGRGMPPTYPALKGSQVALGPMNAHINIVLNGKPGTAMQAFKTQLSDEDLAAVISYERNAWGNNKGDFVMPEQIKAAK